MLEAVAAAAGIRLAFEPGAGRDAFLHPGRAARVLAGGADAGFLGELHPRVAERYELEGPVAVFEVDVATLEAALPTLLVETPFADVPPLRQDIAVVVADEHLAGELEAAVRSAGGPLLQDVGVFDVYRGRGARRRAALAGDPPGVPGRGPDADRRGGQADPREDREGSRRPLRSDPAQLGDR